MSDMRDDAICCPFCNDIWVYHSDDKQMYKLECHCGYAYKHTNWNKDVDDLIYTWNKQAKNLILVPWHKLYTRCNYPKPEYEGNIFLVITDKLFDSDEPHIITARFTNNLYKLDENEFDEITDSVPAFYNISAHGLYKVNATHWCPLPQLPKELMNKDEFYRTNETASND